MRCTIRGRPQQVDVLDTELSGRLVEGVQRGVVAVVGDPDLGLEEDLVAGQAGGGERTADAGLVAVHRGGVDVAVAGLQRDPNGRNELLRRSLVDAEAEGQHLHAVVQGESGNAHW